MPHVVLFVQKNCPHCKTVLGLLKVSGLEYQTIEIDPDLANLSEATEAIGVHASSIKSAPVLIINENIWTGLDAVDALQGREWE